MALRPTGQIASTETGQNQLGHDDEGQRVVVSGSHEALQDYGWPTVWRVAERKYASGDYRAGDTPLVRVTTDDCAGEDDGTG